jgi:hypothetical protein
MRFRQPANQKRDYPIARRFLPDDELPAKMAAVRKIAAAGNHFAGVITRRPRCLDTLFDVVHGHSPRHNPRLPKCLEAKRQSSGWGLATVHTGDDLQV